MSSAEHGSPSGAEQGQDRPDHCQYDPNSPQNRAVDQEPHDEQDDTKSDHDRYVTWSCGERKQLQRVAADFSLCSSPGYPRPPVWSTSRPRCPNGRVRMNVSQTSTMPLMLVR